MTKIGYRFAVGKLGVGRNVLALDRVLPDSKEPQGMTISFQRTVRVPDNGAVNGLPPNMGKFPLFKIQEYASRFPDDMARKGGVFFPMHQKEAMWISFDGTAPFMVKVYVGGVDIVSGEHSQENPATTERRLQLKKQGKTIQDYVVVPRQPWIDGIAAEPGKVRQFVAMPTGQGYTVEAQLTGKEVVGGLQFEITPARCEPEDRCLLGAPRPSETAPPSKAITFFVVNQTGKVFEICCDSNDTIDRLKTIINGRTGLPQASQRFIFAGKQLDDEWLLSDYGTQEGDTLHLTLRLRGGGLIPPAGHELGISPGGYISQDIRRYILDPKKWFKDLTFTIPVHILSPAGFRRATGAEPPPCPIDAKAYANAGLPFFDLFEEEPSDISGADAFAPIQSVNQIEQVRGLVSGAEAAVRPRAVTLYHGGTLGAMIWTGGEVFHVDDAGGLLSSEGPRREVRTLADLEAEVSQTMSDSGSRTMSDSGSRTMSNSGLPS